MLYVFQVDTGTTLTFDMNLALNPVSELQRAIRSQCKIPEEKQVLLISGGENLQREVRVCSYSAGTDTNPIFLFSKCLIESSVPPSASAQYGSETDFKVRVGASLEMPASFETIVSRTQLALQFQDVAKETVKNCEALVHDQHLMQQGWAAVVANLEDVYNEFEKKSGAFLEKWSEFMKERPEIVCLLDDFKTDLLILSKVPMFPNLLVQTSTVDVDVDGKPWSLLDWISSQDEQSSLDQIADQCIKALERLDEKLFDSILREIDSTKENTNKQSMKEIKGLEDRLFGLEQLMAGVKVIVEEQGDMAGSFVANQNRASSLKDPEVLPDLCASHKRQLMHMLKNHQQLLDIRRRCHQAKDELSVNLHTRLRWVMYVEKSLSDVDHKISIYYESVKRLKRKLDVIQQVHSAPSVYAHSAIEVLKRRHYSQSFLKWAEGISKESNSQRSTEMQRRSDFHETVGHHFITRSLFAGLNEMPPSFASAAPLPFDVFLPEITFENIQQLVEALPEMEDVLRIPPEVMDVALFVSATSTRSILAEPLLSSASSKEDDQNQEKDRESHQSSAPSSLAVSDIEVLDDERALYEGEDQQHLSLSSLGTRPPPSGFRASLNQVADDNLRETSPIVPPPSPTAEECSKKARELAAAYPDELDPKLTRMPTPGTTPTEVEFKALARLDSGEACQDRSKTVTPSSSRETSPSSEEAADVAAIPPPDDYAEPITHRLRCPSPPPPLPSSGICDLESSIQTLQQSGDFETAYFESSTALITQSKDAQREKVDQLELLLSKLEEKDAELNARSAECQAVKQDILCKSRSAHSEVVALKTELALVRSTSIRLKDDLSSGLVDAGLRIGAALGVRRRWEEEEEEARRLERDQLLAREAEWKREKEQLLAREEAWRKRVEESDRKAIEWKDRESLMLRQIGDLETNSSERLAEELEKREMQVRREEEEKRRNEINEINLRNAHEIEELTESNSLETVKLKTDLENSLGLKEESLAAAEAALEASEARLAGEIEKREKAEAETLRLAADVDRKEAEWRADAERKKAEWEAEAERTAAEWRRKGEEEKRQRETEWEETKRASEADAEAQRTTWARAEAEMKAEIEALTKESAAREEASKAAVAASQALEERRKAEEEAAKKRTEETFAEEKRKLKEAWEEEIEGDIQQMKKTLKEETKREVKAAEERKEEEAAALRKELKRKEEELAEKEAAMVKLVESQKEKTQKCLDVQKAKLLAEKQQTFNKAVDKITKEKDSVIADLKSRLKTKDITETASQTTDTNLALAREGWGSAGTLSGLQAALTQSGDSGIHQDQHEELAKAHAKIQELELRLGLSSPSPVCPAAAVAAASLASPAAETSRSNSVERPQSAKQPTPTPEDAADHALFSADVSHGPSTMSQSVFVPSSTPLRDVPTSAMTSSVVCGGRFDPHSEGAMAASTAVLPYSEPQSQALARTLVSRDEEIARLNKRLSDLTMTTSTVASVAQNDKVSITSVARGDVVLFCLDEGNDHYVVFHMGPIIHFLHSDCLPAMGLSTPTGTTMTTTTTTPAAEAVVADSSQASASAPSASAGAGQRRQWALGEVTDKEYCQAKKAANRFKVPIGTRFYRVKAVPWSKAKKEEQ